MLGDEWNCYISEIESMTQEARDVVKANLGKVPTHAVKPSWIKLMHVTG